MGKTLTALSFTKPQDNTVRVVTDMESRAWHYQGEEDNPERLKYKFYYWPKPGRRFDTIELLEFYEGLSKGEVAVWGYDLATGEATRETISPDLWVVDNVVLFQRQLQRVVGRKKNAVDIVKRMDLMGFGMLLQYWKAPDPRWWNLLKSIIGELLLAARRSGVSVVATTEAGNMWADYGKGKTATCKGQRVLGRTAKALLTWRQLLDAVWMVDRTVPIEDGRIGLQEKPNVTMDLFNPKGSLVGIPARFKWESWERFWEILDEGEVANDYSEVTQEERNPTPEELIEAEAAEQAVEEPVQEELALRRDAFLQNVVDELGYPDKSSVREALEELGFETYKPDREPQMWKELEARKEA